MLICHSVLYKKVGDFVNFGKVYENKLHINCNKIIN